MKKKKKKERKIPKTREKEREIWRTGCREKAHDSKSRRSDLIFIFYRWSSRSGDKFRFNEKKRKEKKERKSASLRKRKGDERRCRYSRHDTSDLDASIKRVLDPPPSFLASLARLVGLDATWSNHHRRFHLLHACVSRLICKILYGNINSQFIG